MSKKTYIIVGVIALFVLGGGATGAYLYLNKAPDAKLRLAMQSVDVSAAGKTAVLGTQTKSSSGGTGLSVTSGASGDLASQGLGAGGSLPVGGGLGSSASTNSSSSTPSASEIYAKAPGPDTFKQYDQYKDSKDALFADIVVGSGAEVTNGQKVAVYYKGWLTNGELFDQSRADGDGNPQTFTFEIGKHEVIAGWEQDIVGMKVGGIRRMIIPPAVGYGATGQGETIPPNSVLVFDVQLINAL